MKNIKSNRLKRTTTTPGIMTSFARGTMWGLGLVTVMGLVYASNNITDITDSVTTGDTITADWFNNINSILAGSDTHKLGVTQSPTLAHEGTADEQLVSKAYVDAKTDAAYAQGGKCLAMKRCTEHQHKRGISAFNYCIEWSYSYTDCP